MNVVKKVESGRTVYLINHPKLGQLHLGAIGQTAVRVVVPRLIQVLVDGRDKGLAATPIKDHPELHGGYPVAVSMTVDPFTAATWLLENPCNRTLMVGRVLTVSDQILGGLWTDGNDAVCFSTSKKLLNGQHRLYGIVHAGKAAVLPVRFGMGDESFPNMDQNMQRNAAQILSIAGEQYAKQKKHVASAVLQIAGRPASNATRIAVARYLSHDVESVCGVLQHTIWKQALLTALVLGRRYDGEAVDRLCLELYNREFTMECVKLLYDVAMSPTRRGAPVKEAVAKAARVVKCMSDGTDVRQLKASNDAIQFVSTECRAVVAAALGS